ncbi:MAG: hypothetical protein V7K40_28030 [Nostoc sp.]
MRVHIHKDWTFIEAAKASWTYRGGGIQGEEAEAALSVVATGVNNLTH